MRPCLMPDGRATFCMQSAMGIDLKDAEKLANQTLGCPIPETLVRINGGYW